MPQDYTFDSYCKKRVSFILATRNHADKLDEALGRCREFKKPEDELIIMDGVSTDHTKEIIEKYKDIIDIFISEPDLFPLKAVMRNEQGNPLGGDPIHAINKGILLSRGKWIKIISDDDIYHPEAIKKTIQTLEQNPDIDLLMCGGVSERFGRLVNVYLPPETNYGKNIEDVFRYGRISGVGHFYKKLALANVGLHPFYKIKFDFTNFTILINADAEYVLRFFKAGCKVRFCRINLFYSPYSHKDYKARNIIEKTDLYWLNAAKHYTSWSFYIRYWLKRKFLASKLGHKFLQIRKLIRRRIKNPEIKKLLGKKKSSQEMIWDEELS